MLLSRIFSIVVVGLLALGAVCAQKPEIYVPTGHISAPTTIAISIDGRTLASCDDNQIKIWDAASRVELRTLNGHKNSTNALAFGPVGDILASGGGDNSIRFWNTATGTEQRELKGHTDTVTTLAFSPDGEFLVSGSTDKTVRIWNVASGEIVRTIKDHTDRVTSVAIEGSGRYLVSGSWDQTVRVWDLNSGSLVKSLAAGGSVDSVAFSRDGKLVAGGGKVWNSGTWDESPLVVGFANFSSIAFSPDGTKLAGGSASGIISVWDLNGGKAARRLTGKDIPNSVEARSVVFSPDGATIFSANSDRTIRFWNANAGKILRTLVGHSQAVEKVAMSEDGRWAATASADNSVIIWDTASGSVKHKIDPGKFGAASLAFSPDGKLFVTGTVGDIMFWNVETGEQIAILTDAHASTVGLLRFSDASDRLLSMSDDGGFDSIREELKTRRPSAKKTAKVWNVSDRKLLSSLEGLAVVSALSPDGAHIAGTKADQKLTIFDAKTGREIRRFDDLLSENAGIHFGPGGSVTVANTGGARTYNFLTGTVSKGSSASTIIPISGKIALVNNGTTMVGAGYANTITVSSVESGRILRSLAGHTSDLKSVAASGDGAFVVGGGEDGTAIIWKVDERAELAVSSSSMFLNSIEFNKDFDMMAQYGASSGEIALWDFKRGERLSNFKSGALVGGVAFHPTKRVLASVQNPTLDTDSKITIWDLDSATIVKTKLLSSGKFFSPSMLLFSLDGGSVLVTGSGQLFVWDVEKDTLQTRPGGELFSPDVTSRFPRGSLATELETRGFVRQEGNKVTVQDPTSKKEFFSMYNLSENDWAVTTPDGLFDGSPGGYRRVLWRFDGNTFQYAPAEAFFNEFYRPQLLKEIRSGTIPNAPAKDLQSVDIRQPSVSIVEANELFKTTQPTVEISVSVTANDSKGRRSDHADSSGARDLRLFRNGSLVKKWAGDVFNGASGCETLQVKAGEPRKAICKTRITVTAGDNNLSAYAFNTQNVKSTDAIAMVRGADSLKKDGTLYVLAVGVNKYADATHNLKYAVADVDAIGRRISEEQAALKHYARTEVIKLTDADATRSNILLALKRFADGGEQSGIPESVRAELSKIRKSQPEDAIIFHFSGHGTARCQTDAKTQTRNCDRFYLLPHDGFPVGNFPDEGGRLAQLYANSISDEDLEMVFEKIDAGKFLMVIDACNSGQALEAEEKRRGPMNSRGLAQLAYEKGMYILTASQSTQAALEVNLLGHGLLTYALLDGLKKADKSPENAIIDRSWFNYASAAVPALQLGEMQKRDAAIKQGTATKDIGVNFVEGEDASLPPEKRGLQSPKIFYRRETDLRPFVVARP